MKIISNWVALALLALSNQVLATTFDSKHWQTSNGTTVVYYKAMEVPMLEISIAFAAGSAYDGNYFGLSSLTTNLINQGNAGLDATEIAERLADTGAQFNAASNRDMALLNLKTLSEPQSLQPALDVFEKIIAHADFPEDAFNREKKQQLLSIAQIDESPSDLANQFFYAKLYNNHPYAHPVEGSKEQVVAIQRKQINEFYQTYFVSSNAVLVIVGAVDEEKAHQIAEQLTAKLPKGKPAPSIPKAVQLTKSETVEIDYPASQTVLRLGQLGINHHNPDYFSLTLGNYILGGGALVSRLSEEVREKRGLTYGVTSQFIPMPGDGPFLISLSTRNQQAATALKITEDTLTRFIKEGPEDHEITAAKQYLIGSFPLSLASNGSIANMLLRIAFYHLPDDYLDQYTTKINQVTRAQIKEAFQRQINPEKMLLISVGKM